ncbi:MAG TPA: helix-turn-helix transcriptional regulator [Geminicoccaceae bacterium]|nr:helix-turn-helix transcriptional regulator [Geminicoccaceae bacterium]
MSLQLSQEWLGQLLGVTYQQIQKYERGANRIGSSRLHELCRVLGVPVGYFFDETAPPAAAPQALREAGIGFVPEVQAPVAAGRPALGAPDGQEALELLRAFNGIADPGVRRQLLELARTLVGMPHQGSARDQGDA